MSEPNRPPSIEDPVQKMNQMYRWTRHVYDVSRRYYLLGRDATLRDIAALPGGDVLEVGCGTARNLRLLDAWAPQHTLYGLDASLSMLATARSKLEKAGCTERITLGHGLAQDLAPRKQLHTQGPFDVILFSYVLSMIPSWRTVLREALTHLSPTGRLYVVDFWDQNRLPDWIATLLQQWLALFDVCPRPAVPNTLAQLGQTARFDCELDGIARRYAYRIRLKRSGSLSRSALQILDGPSTSAAEPQSPSGPKDTPLSSSTVSGEKS